MHASHLSPTLSRIRTVTAATPGIAGARASGRVEEWRLTSCDVCGAGITTVVFCCVGGKCAHHLCPGCVATGSRAKCGREVCLSITELDGKLAAWGPASDGPPPPMRIGLLRGVLYEDAAAGTEPLFRAVDEAGAPALLKSRCSLRELDVLPRDAMVNARIFVDGETCATSRRIQLGAFLDRLERGDMGGEGWQLYDFPHPDNFGKGASVATVLPKACAAFAASIVDEADLSAALMGSKPHMVQAYLSVGHTVTALHWDHGGMAENLALYSSGPRRAVCAVWLFFERRFNEGIIAFAASKRANVANGDFFLTRDYLTELKALGITPTVVEQRVGDVVVVPIGCLHQVINLTCNLKVARDFLPASSIERQLAHHATMRRLRPRGDWLLLHPEQIAILSIGV